MAGLPVLPYGLPPIPEPALPENPLAPQGMTPRSALDTAEAPRAPYNPDTDPNNQYKPGGGASEIERGVHAAAGGIGVGLQRLKGLAQSLTGDKAGALDTLRAAQASQERNEHEGPTISSLYTRNADGSVTSNIHGVGDAASYAAGLAGEALPNLATMLIPGGVGARVGRGLAERGIARGAEEMAATAATKALAEGATKEAAAHVASETAARATPKLAAMAGEAGETGAKIGEVAGATLGGVPATAGTTDLTPEQIAANPGKMALGTLAASAAGALPAARLLERAGAGREAGAAVAAATEKLLPRIAKEALKQGAVGAAGAVAQTAATLATHKWIDHNVDMLSPQAFDQYLNSIVAGGTIGAATGGLLEGLKGAKAPTLPGLDDKFASLKQNLRDFANKPDQPVEGGGTAAPAEDPMVGSAKIFQDAHGAIQNPEAKAAFAGAFKFNADDPVGAVMAAYTKAVAKAQGIPGAVKSLHDMMDKFLSKHATEEVSLEEQHTPMERLDKELANADDEEHAHGVLEKADQAHQAFMQGAEPLGGEAPRATNPFHLPSALENTLASFIPKDHPLWGVADTLKGMVKSVAKLFTGDEVTDPDRKNVGLMQRIVGRDTMAKWKAVGPDYAELSKAAKHYGADAEETTPPTHAAPARDELVSKEHLLTQNNASPKARAFWERTSARDGVWEVESNVPGRKQAADVSTMVAARLSGEAKGTGETPHQALAHVIADLNLAGVQVKPESIKAGTFYKSQDGATEAKLTPKQAAALRGELVKPPMSPAAKAVGKVKTALAEKQRQETMAKSPKTIEASDEQVQRESFDKAASEGFESDKQRRAPREQPPTDIGGGVADIETRTPYEGVVSGVRQAWGKATPAQRAKLVHEAGVKIGTREIDRAKLSERTTALLKKRLADPESGASRDYFKKAGEGKFDAARVRETKSDDAHLSTKGQSDAAAAVKEAARRALGKKFVSEADVEKAIHEALNAKEPTKIQSDLARVARKAVDVLGEEHPYARAVEGASKESAVREHEPPDKVTEAGDREARSKAEAKKKASREDREIDDGLGEAAKPSGHDTEKETSMANAALERIAFKGPRITIKSPPAGAKVSGGKWSPKDNTIYVADHIHGAQRIEVIMHELGHHVIAHELGETLEKAPLALRQALLKDYEKWVRKNFNADSTYADVRASRAAYFRGEAIKARKANEKPISGMDEKDVGYLFDHNEWMADHFARAMTQKSEGQSIIGKFFAGIASKLRDLYDTMSGGDRTKYAPAKSVDDWVQTLFDRNTNDVRKAEQQGVPREAAEAATHSAVHAAMNAETTGSVTQSAAYKAWGNFVKYKLTPAERGMLERMAYRRPIMDQIRARFADDQELLKHIETQETEIQSLTWAVNKMIGEGKLDVGAKWYEPVLALRNSLLKIFGVAGNNEMAMKLFEDIRSGEVERMRSTPGYKYDVMHKAYLERGAIQDTFNTAYTLARNNIYDPWRRFMYGPSSNAHISYTPALRVIQSKLKLAAGAVGERHGIEQDKIRQRVRFDSMLAKSVAGLTDGQKKTLLDHLQMHTESDDPALKAALDGVRRTFQQGYQYAKEAGVDFPSRGEKYFPVAPDVAQIESREGDFKRFFSDPKWKPFLDEMKLDPEKLFKVATGKARLETEAPVDPLKAPGFDAMNPRLWQFVYDHGTADDIRTLAGFQAKSLDAVATPYFEHLTNRAEFARRFADDGSKLKGLLDEAVKQGASPKDIDYMRNTVAAHTGAYAADGSPLVRSIFGDKASQWFADPKTKAGVSALMAYQNVRVLPLALLSSLADPMGIGVRYGGIKSMKDLSQAWKSFKDGMAAMHKGMDKTGLKEQAEIIHMANDYFTSAMLTEGNAPGLEGFSKKVSDAMFRWNGMNWFVRSTRFMALSAANAFLLKHAAGRDPQHSTRYLNELGVKDGDIRTGKNGLVKLATDAEREDPKVREADDRVRNALARFVDEAILRTDASQHPHYMNDPALRLLTQYKQFGYAFADQIIDRIVHEIHYSNLHVLGPAMGYVPITIAAEMLRGMVQYGPGGNPQRADWSPLDWAALGGERSGLLGPRIGAGLGVLEGKGYAGMQHMGDFGPTAGQLKDVLQSLEGERGIEPTLVESLPASSLYRHWSVP